MRKTFIQTGRSVACVTAAVLMACCLAGCGSVTGDASDGTVKEKTKTVKEKVTPAPEETATPTPAPSYIKDGVYTSEDKTVSLRLPDDSWDVKAQEKDMHSLVSEKQGGILILHGKGEDDMASVVIPDTQDLAVSLEQASEMEQGLDFVIEDYSSTNENGVNVYDYTVHYLNTAKSGGNAYAINKFFVTDNEYYNLAGTIRKEAYLADIRSSVDSFKVLDGSVFQSVAVGNDPVVTASPEAVETEGDTGAQEADNAAGETEQYFSGYSDDQLADTGATRTIYRNSDGMPIVIVPDGSGNWFDEYGNSYWFMNDEDVYDQDGVDYYWHGEAGDVAFMSGGE